LDEESDLEEVNKAIPTIYAWFYTRKRIRFELIFRGTRDGFTSAAFHEKLDG
jgi:hypothetical protein